MGHIPPKSILETNWTIGSFPYLIVKKSVCLLMKEMVHKGEVKGRNEVQKSQVETEMHVRILTHYPVGDTS